MTKQQSYRVVSFVILALSISAAVFLAFSLGSVIHFGQQAVSAMSGGPAPTAAAPTSTGWVAIVLAAITTFAGPGWSSFFAKLADAAPVITTIATQIPQLQGFAARLKVSPLGSLLPLLESIDVTGDRVVTSTGTHPVPGGSVEWKITFTPTTLPQ